MFISLLLAIGAFSAAAFAASNEPPGSEQNPLKYRLFEELTEKTWVGDVVEDAELVKQYQPNELDKIAFSILTKRDDTQYFSISQKGVLKLAVPIDREAICPYKETCIITMNVGLRIDVRFKVLSVEVEILDLNDNWPVFPQTSIHRSISEAAEVKTTIGLITAVDKDKPSHGVLKYELKRTRAAEAFALRTVRRFDGSEDLLLVVQKGLDREKKDSYQLQVVALDGRESVSSGVLKVNLTVLDANDWAPVFTNATYRVEIPENLPARSTFLRVLATDRDIGKNAQVTYSLSQRSQDNHGHLFSVTRDSGQLYLRERGLLDYEETKTYQLTVIATDGGAGSRPASAQVIVSIRDVNDFSPQLSINTLTKDGVALILENSDVGTFIAHVSAVDKDSGKNGEMSCNIDSERFNLDRLQVNQYKVVTARRLDREDREYYDVTLECKDHGSPALTTRKSMTIRVSDQNDHAPVFNEKSYTVAIRENNRVKDIILTVNATDRDAGQNAELRYYIISDVDGLVSLDAVSGQLRANAVFDHEQLRALDFRIRVTDLGVPSFSATAAVHIDVIDVNDVAPEFPQPVYVFAVHENRAVEEEVGRVRAYDADSEPFNKVTYAFLEGHRPSQRQHSFNIDSSSGLITTKAKLDREEIATYNMVVIAQNTASPPLSSTASIRVFIGDENDNAPRLLYPTNTNNTLHISNKVPVGHVIARIRALDNDAGNNARLIYRISGGNSNGFFHLETETGALTTNMHLDQFDTQTFVLDLVVSDQGTPSLQTKSNLTVVVNRTLTFGVPPGAAHSLLTGTNLTIVIALAACSGTLMLVLIAAIIVIRRQDARKRNQHKYNCRAMEAQKMLSINGKVTAAPDKMAATTAGSKVTVDIRDECAKARVTKVDGGDSRPIEQYSIAPRPVTAVRPNAKIGSQQKPIYHIDRTPGPPPPQYPGKQWSLTDREVQVQRFLDQLQPPRAPQEPDDDSQCSGDASNADSGRGASEEGEHSASRVKFKEPTCVFLRTWDDTHV